MILALRDQDNVTEGRVLISSGGLIPWKSGKVLQRSDKGTLVQLYFGTVVLCQRGEMKRVL